MSEGVSSAVQPAVEKQSSSIIGYLLPKIIVIGAIYAAFSYFLMRPQVQWDIGRIVYSAYSMDSPEAASAALDEAEKRLKAMEARAARFKDPAFAARAADILKRQQELGQAIERAGAQTVPAVKGIDTLQTKLSELENGVAKLEKSDKGTYDKQLQDAVSRVQLLQARIEALEQLGGKVGKQLEVATTLEIDMKGLKQKEIGAVALMVDLNKRVADLETDITTVEKGDPKDSKSNKTLAAQTEAAEIATIQHKKRIQTLVELTGRIQALRASVNLGPVTPMIADRKQ